MGGWLRNVGCGSSGRNKWQEKGRRMAFDDGIWTSRSPGLQHASTCMEPVYLGAGRALGGGRALRRVKHRYQLLRQLKANMWKNWDPRMNIPCLPAHPEVGQNPGHKHFGTRKGLSGHRMVLLSMQRMGLKSALFYFFFHFLRSQVQVCCDVAAAWCHHFLSDSRFASVQDHQKTKRFGFLCGRGCISLKKKKKKSSEPRARCF